MAKLTLEVPASMAEYWQKTELDEEMKTRSRAMMFYPLMRKGMLTHMEVARILGIEEDTLNAIYDDYELPHRTARYKDYANSLDEFFRPFRKNYMKNAEENHVG